MRQLDHSRLAASNASGALLRAIASPINIAPVRVELHRPAGLARKERRHWAELSARAAPGNIFAQHWFMEPALRHCGTDWSLRLAVVRQGSGAWLGVLPITLAHSIGGRPAPGWHGWRTANQFLGTPLVLPGAEKAFWQALLARLDRRPGLGLGFHCGPLPVTDPATLALASLCAEQGRKLHISESFTRPARLPSNKPDPEAARQLDQQLDPLEQQLESVLGPVDVVLHDRDADCGPWLAAFIALERSGRKGRDNGKPVRGDATAGLLRETLRHGHRSGTLRLASLTAGERIVAMTSWFVTDSFGYGFKMAHDAAWSSYAPDRLLMRRVARMVTDEGLRVFDTCMAPDAPHEPLWPDRRAFGGFAIGIGGPARRALFDGLMRAKAD